MNESNTLVTSCEPNESDSSDEDHLPEFDLSKLDIQTVGRLELTEHTLLIFAAPDSYSPQQLNKFHEALNRLWLRNEWPGAPLVVPHGMVIVGVAQEAVAADG